MTTSNGKPVREPNLADVLKFDESIKEVAATMIANLSMIHTLKSMMPIGVCPIGSWALGVATADSDRDLICTFSGMTRLMSETNDNRTRVAKPHFEKDGTWTMVVNLTVHGERQEYFMHTDARFLEVANAYIRAIEITTPASRLALRAMLGKLDCYRYLGIPLGSDGYRRTGVQSTERPEYFGRLHPRLEAVAEGGI